MEKAAASSSPWYAEILDRTIDNPRNEYVLQHSAAEWRAEVQTALRDLLLPRDTVREWMRKLKGYRYVREPHEMREGGYLRWVMMADDAVPRNNGNDGRSNARLSLAKGAIFCYLRTNEEGEPICVCRNFGVGSATTKHFEVPFHDTFFFQRFSDQEWLLLQALEAVVTQPAGKGK